jgi:hypothetical protein
MSGSATVAGPRFGVVFCPRGAGGFPSATSPIFDTSTFAYDATTGDSRLETLAGFAADGVGQVGVVEANGAVHLARVVRNTYAEADIAARAITTIIALDRRGRELYRMPLAGQ